MGKEVKQILKYPGAKWRLAPWIISFFPEHHSYLEPFFGSGAVLFRKERSDIETINDLDGNVINFFECVKNDPEKLAHEIYFTPYARDVYERAYTIQKTKMFKDRYEQAASFLICCNMAHGFRTSGTHVGWKEDIAGRERAYAAMYWTSIPEALIDAADRLRGVQVENKPAVNLISKFNFADVLIYADPPYCHTTRTGGKQYYHEMTDDDHLELLHTLKRHKGPAIISGYSSQLYEEELRDWHRETKMTTNLLAQAREEVVWMNFEPMDQISLFSDCPHPASK